MRRAATGLRGIRSPRGGRGASAFLGLVAAGLGVALLASTRREQSAPERVGEDELPSAADFEAQLDALGLTPTGEPKRLEEPPQRLDVIDVPGTAVPHEAPTMVPPPQNS